MKKDTQLFIKVYHIGYSVQGESCIFIMHTLDNTVLYSLAIDCYEEDGNNITSKILTHWKLEGKLNAFIWSHPHDDHSVGVSFIIKKYCNKDSVICMANIFGVKDICSDISKKNIEDICSLLYRKQNKNKWNINSMAHFPETLDEIRFNGLCEVQRLIVQCISPFPELSALEVTKKRPNFNRMGIGCILSVELKNQYINFLFAGDMENDSIEKLIEKADESIPSVYNYVKIPHHGSENAINMVEFLNREESIKSEFASVSVFKKHGLPQNKTIKNYKKVIESVSCTTDITKNEYKKGVIALTYDLSQKKFDYNFYGAACLL